MQQINPINTTFNASYNYGPQEERIIPQSWIENLYETTIVMPFKVMIYPGASISKNIFIDSDRVKKAQNQLLAIGAQSVKITTPDGDILDGMYLNSKDLKKCLEKYFDLIEITNDNDTTEKRLVLKKEYCLEPEVDQPQNGKPISIKPNKEAETFINNIKGLGIFVTNQISLNNANVRLPCINLEVVSENLPPIIDTDEITSQPTALIVGGSGMSYSAYKGLAVAYLSKGINVMLVDLRGYGDSEGSPTAHKTKLDLESAYQYLSIEKGVKNQDLLVHGHCLGGGSAADLAARRKGVNLVLDRSFAEYRDVATNRYPVISGIVYKIMPWIVHYNNVENIGKIEGNIAIEMAKNDAVIEEEQTIKQINSLPNSKIGQVFKLMDSPDGHTGIWTDDKNTSLQFNQFLEQSNLRRRVF